MKGNANISVRAARSLLASHGPNFRRTQPRPHGGEMATSAAVLADTSVGMETRLWQAVIVTTIQEWISGTLRSKRQAEEYLFQDQRDFAVVCQRAGLDPGVLRSKLNRLRQQDGAHRGFER